jgi:hypothetical protein
VAQLLTTIAAFLTQFPEFSTIPRPPIHVQGASIRQEIPAKHGHGVQIWRRVSIFEANECCQLWKPVSKIGNPCPLLAKFSRLTLAPCTGFGGRDVVENCGNSMTNPAMVERSWATNTILSYENRPFAPNQ